MAARLELIAFPLQKGLPTLALTIVVIRESLDLDTHHLMHGLTLKLNQFLKVRSFFPHFYTQYTASFYPIFSFTKA